MDWELQWNQIYNERDPMNIFKLKSFLVLMLVLFISSAFSLEKATIYYKNGEILDCHVEKYEIGKYAEIIDNENNKRIIAWDSIKEIVFAKAEVLPVVKESRSMMDDFEYKEEVASPKEEVFIKDIQEENAGNKPTIDLDKKTGEISVDYYQTLESDAKRRCWLEEGGTLKSKGLTINYTHASMGMDIMGDGNETDFTMNGFGFAYSWAFKFISPPSYSEGKNGWNAFSLAFMGSFNMTNGSMDMEMIGFDWDTMTTYTYDAEVNIETLTYEISSNLGYTFGLGKYWSDADWKGIMLGVYWKPNFTISKNTTEMDGKYTANDPTSTFNAKGIQWTIDWGTFGALSEKLAEEAHFSINGFILPETDDTPFLISIGIGAVWY